MASIELREITEENRDAVLAIHAGPAEGRFVTSTADSIAEAAESPEGNPWYRAVYLEGEPVGFVMLSWDVTPQPPDIIGPWFLWKLLVDERHQRRGIGRAIVDEVVRIIRAEGATELFTSNVVAEGGPDGFYERLGFAPTGGRRESASCFSISLHGTDSPADSLQPTLHHMQIVISSRDGTDADLDHVRPGARASPTGAGAGHVDGRTDPRGG
jgi:diamine N-acetyltransferase